MDRSIDDLNLLGVTSAREITKGAEARILIAEYLGDPVIIKHRFEKKYRNVIIDTKLRKERTIQEVRLLQTAGEIGLKVPIVYDVDKSVWAIIMQQIPAEPIKEHLEKDISSKFFKLGIEIALLHNNNLIHGDLTTSNIFIDNQGDIWLIDFGLGFISTNIEDRAVDNLVLKHILESSHPTIAEVAWKAFLNGYKEKYISFKEIEKRMNVVELRVRYKSH